jgi:hypothetical protein
MFQVDNTRHGFIGYEGYRYVKELGGYFLLSESADRKRLAIVVPWLNRICSLIQPRITEEHVSARGICMDHAFIAGADPKIHDDIAITGSWNGIRLSFSTQVVDSVDDGPSLLQRGARIFEFPEAKMLRNSKREVANLRGSELAFIDTPKAGSKYSLE